MKASSILTVLLLLLNVTAFPTYGKTFIPIGHDGGSHRIYIVHVTKPSDKKFHLFKQRKEWYMSYLPNATLSSGWPRLVYAYRQVITGFAAWLTQEEVNAMKAMDGFLFSSEDDDLQPRTTYTYEFLGLTSDGSPDMWFNSNYGGGQIIGVIDSGVTPNHPSFGDLGVPPPDLSKWKGSCYWGPPICNNKLIGAQGFSGGMSISPLDMRGHGTHCASIAAGNIVHNASYEGAAQGKASGMAPKAHLAVYKINTTADLLRCIDEAIRNHVDVLSISQGHAKEFIYSGIIKGAFAASTKGIVTCAAAPNGGPTPNSIDNDAPWIITVGACTTDRKIASVVKLGGGQEFLGESVSAGKWLATPQLPLVNVRTCYPDIGKHDVVGKIVICEGKYLISFIGDIVQKAGGPGVIVISLQGNYTQPTINDIPASHVTSDDGTKIEEYFLSSPNATAAIIFRGTQFGAKPAPAVARSSGRGPSLQNGDIIKPDIIAPGVNILVASPSESNSTGKQATFVFQSGTSMATPHVAGIAALLKHNHPTWSPAAIQSAIMTTAKSRDRDGNRITDQNNGKIATAFDMGSGMVNPLAANDPGLIYDIKPLWIGALL
ncbi:hypothetical protein HPP92_000074 [Vanilla planifolia]|uniref:Uncharacterized protein n=1 Tax=Vanilla planifolia TaxID=51239 RepID=A0A835VFL5_VANPL|nr:hypothetical protein HPP92_000074 [Vanilla planifolia]